MPGSPGERSFQAGQDRRIWRFASSTSWVKSRSSRLGARRGMSGSPAAEVHAEAHPVRAPRGAHGVFEDHGQPVRPEVVAARVETEDLDPGLPALEGPPDV